MRINALNYPSLQDALDDARDGDRVYMPSTRVYNSPPGGFLITKRIELYGDGPGQGPDDSGTVLKPSGTDSVLVINPAGLGALANLYLHDFRIAGPGGGNGVQCLTTPDDKVSNLRVERVRVSNLGGVGFAFLGTLGWGRIGDVVAPLLRECVAEKCGGGGAVFIKTFVGNVTHCRFADGGSAMAGSALLRAEQSALAVYACVFEGSQAATSQLEFLNSVSPRVDACRFKNFPIDSPVAEQRSALRIFQSQGAVVGCCYFELDSPAAGSKGIYVVPDVALAGPVLILPSRFRNVENLVYMKVSSPLPSLDVKAAVVLPQFDDSTSGKMVLPQDTNRGLVAVPSMNRPGSNVLSGLALPSDGLVGQDPTYNETDGTLAYRMASNVGQVRAYMGGSWHTVRIGPAAVNTLQIRGRGRHSLAVGWTTPQGGATQYLLKRSYSPITDANFDSAASVPGVPTPGAPGSDVCVVDSGLLECKRHYYALKSVDAQGRYSMISNLVSSSTFCSGSMEAQCL